MRPHRADHPKRAWRAINARVISSRATRDSRIYNLLVWLEPLALRPLSLSRIGRLHGTDKAAAQHTHGGRTNCDVYERYIRHWRHKKFTLLEIGVREGASMRMWRAYFPRARILGLDIDPAAAPGPRRGFEILSGSQTDAALLDRAITPDLFFVIDDGSHVNELTVATFRHVFPRLPPGGIYVIEDTTSSYEPALRSWPGMTRVPLEVSLDNERRDIDALLIELQHDCDLNEASRSVAYVHVWPGLVIVGRA